MECRKLWTEYEERWLRNHAGDGAAIIANLLGREPREVILHGLEIGVDVAPRPELGERCPWCGHRMTPHGTGYRLGGICDACWNRHLVDSKAAFKREKAAYNAWNADKVRAWRERHG